jgi:indolepyruvate ferredoxin oxidoreductase
MPAMAALRSARRLRGTPLDPFGRTALRRQERELPLEYAAGIHALLATLDATSLPAAAEVARLPDLVRGFEEVKMRSIAAYRAQLHAELDAFRRRGGAEASRRGALAPGGAKTSEQHVSKEWSASESRS